MSKFNWSAANNRRRMSHRGSTPIGSGRVSNAKREALPLTEPIIIDRWWKNRAHDAVYVRLAPFKNMTLIDVRVWETGPSDGITRPGKGISVRVQHLARLHAALGKALAKARELGLIDDVVAANGESGE
jgi:hypothetical protein